MAFAPTGFYLTMTFRDSGGDITNKTVEINAATMADALADAAAAVALWNAVTDASIDAYSVSQKFTEGAPTVFADATVRNSVQALVSVSLAADVNKKATISIPAPNIGIFSGVTGENSDIVDGADPALVALIEAYQLGGLMFLSDGEVVHATSPNIRGVRRTVRRTLA